MRTRPLCRAEKITSYSQIIKKSEMAVDDLVEELTNKLRLAASIAWYPLLSIY